MFRTPGREICSASRAPALTTIGIALADMACTSLTPKPQVELVPGPRPLVQVHAADPTCPWSLLTSLPVHGWPLLARWLLRYNLQSFEQQGSDIAAAPFPL